MGEIRTISWGFAPQGWALCNGQLLPINQNQALFSLLGTQFGGDGRVNFALPDLRGRCAIHQGQGFIIGQRGGEENHTLNQSEMPAHNHTVQATPNAGDSNKPKNDVPANSQPTQAYTSLPNASTAVAMNPAMVSTVGGSQPHTNMQPFLVVGYIIALQGVFPSRN
jgi:microcystin-dependent protein